MDAIIRRGIRPSPAGGFAEGCGFGRRGFLGGMTPRSARIARVLLARLQAADPVPAAAEREELVFKVLLGEAISDTAVVRRIAHALPSVRRDSEPTRAEIQELADLLDVHLPLT